jgi:hypothetical protein
VEYKEKHSHTLIPQHYPENPPLANWVMLQRQYYRNYCNSEQPCNLNEERIRLLNDIGFSWDGNAARGRWTEKLEQVVQYKKEHGDTFVPTNYPNNPPLGNWVKAQRQYYKKYCNNEQPCYMNDEKIRLLNDIGFCWDGNKLKWTDRLQELVEYQEKHGDTLVPQHYAENLPLANWVMLQRQYYKNYCNNEQPCYMNDEKVRLLNDIGFSWEGNTARGRWMDRLQDLVEYKEKHGDTLVPRSYPGNPPLANWVMTQRRHYTNYCNNEQSCWLNEEKIRLLNDIGFRWKAPTGARRNAARGGTWMDRLQDLVEYKEKHGDTLVPTKYPENPPLTYWVKTQRRHYKKYCNNEQSCWLNEEKIRLLNDIGFRWKAPMGARRNAARGGTWMDRLQDLVEYKEKHGDTLVPTHYPENLPLANWVKAQRHHHKKYCNNEQPCYLNEERMRLLNDIGFCWEAPAGRPSRKYYRVVD